MASASEDDSEGDLFVGFDEEDQEAVAAVRQARFEARQESDSELDISDILDVSSVATATFLKNLRRQIVKSKPCSKGSQYFAAKTILLRLLGRTKR